ncbi:MAG: hypothetical protein ACRD4Y_02965 [Candidatus Acidiferrales bacterium]
MSKSLSVVALALFVLSGAVGLRHIVTSNATTISGASTHVTLANGPFPPSRGGSGGGGS